MEKRERGVSGNDMKGEVGRKGDTGCVEGWERICRGRKVGGWKVGLQVGPMPQVSFLLGIYWPKHDGTTATPQERIWRAYFGERMEKGCLEQIRKAMFGGRMERTDMKGVVGMVDEPGQMGLRPSSFHVYARFRLTFSPFGYWRSSDFHEADIAPESSHVSIKPKNIFHANNVFSSTLLSFLFFFFHFFAFVLSTF